MTTNPAKTEMPDEDMFDSTKHRFKRYIILNDKGDTVGNQVFDDWCDASEEIHDWAINGKDYHIALLDTDQLNIRADLASQPVSVPETDNKSVVAENAISEPLQKLQQFNDRKLCPIKALNRLKNRTNWYGGVNGSSLDRIDYEIILESLQKSDVSNLLKDLEELINNNSMHFLEEGIREIIAAHSSKDMN